MPGYLGKVRISEGLASQLMLLSQMAEVHDGGKVRDSLVEGESGKVTVLPCGRRKDIKKSPRTRDKLVARDKVAQLLTCARSRVKPESIQLEP